VPLATSRPLAASGYGGRRTNSLTGQAQAGHVR
jgi:hypothetical protein